jgi:hypothetical protein
MSAMDEFAALLEKTEVMKQVLRSVREEPAYLLRDICRDHQHTGLAVPDHRLQLMGYMGGAALKALLAAGLIKQHAGGRLALYTYGPTEKGLEQYEKLGVDGFY